MAMITVLILAGYVLPQFKPLFEELGAELPLATRMLLAFSRLFTDLWFITAGFFIVIAAILIFLFKHPTGKLWKDRLVLKIPVIKGIVDYCDPRAVLPHPVGDARRRRAAARRAQDHDRRDEQHRLQGAPRDRAGRRCSRARASPSRSSTPICSPAPPNRCSRSARRPARSTSSWPWRACTSIVSSRAASRTSPPCSNR